MKRLLNVDWLLRIPLAIVFLQQGLSKVPISIEEAAGYNLPMLVWIFVVLGELGAGLGLIIGGLIQKLWSTIYSALKTMPRTIILSHLSLEKIIKDNDQYKSIHIEKVRLKFKI